MEDERNEGFLHSGREIFYKKGYSAKYKWHFELVDVPIALPAIVTTIGGYVAVAGGVLTAASQLTTTDDSK